MRRRQPRVSRDELQRAAAFRSALRQFLARTNDVAASAGLTAQRYDLLLAIKTGDGETSTVSELVKRLSLPQPAVTELVKRAEETGLITRSPGVDRRVWVLRLTPSADERLLQAFVALRAERLQLADSMRAVDRSFRAFVEVRNKAAR